MIRLDPKKNASTAELIVSSPNQKQTTPIQKAIKSSSTSEEKKLMRDLNVTSIRHLESPTTVPEENKIWKLFKNYFNNNSDLEFIKEICAQYYLNDSFCLIDLLYFHAHERFDQFSFSFKNILNHPTKEKLITKTEEIKNIFCKTYIDVLILITEIYKEENENSILKVLNLRSNNQLLLDTQIEIIKNSRRKLLQSMIDLPSDQQHLKNKLTEIQNILRILLQCLNYRPNSDSERCPAILLSCYTINQFGYLKLRSNSHFDAKIEECINYAIYLSCIYSKENKITKLFPTETILNIKNELSRLKLVKSNKKSNNEYDNINCLLKNLKKHNDKLCETQGDLRTAKEKLVAKKGGLSSDRAISPEEQEKNTRLILLVRASVNDFYRLVEKVIIEKMENESRISHKPLEQHHQDTMRYIEELTNTIPYLSVELTEAPDILQKFTDLFFKLISYRNLTLINENCTLYKNICHKIILQNVKNCVPNLLDKWISYGSDFIFETKNSIQTTLTKIGDDASRRELFSQQLKALIKPLCQLFILNHFLGLIIEAETEGGLIEEPADILPENFKEFIFWLLEMTQQTSIQENQIDSDDDRPDLIENLDFHPNESSDGRKDQPASEAEIHPSEETFGAVQNQDFNDIVYAAAENKQGNQLEMKTPIKVNSVVAKKLTRDLLKTNTTQLNSSTAKSKREVETLDSQNLQSIKTPQRELSFNRRDVPTKRRKLIAFVRELLKDQTKEKGVVITLESSKGSHQHLKKSNTTGPVVLLSKPRGKNGYKPGTHHSIVNSVKDFVS